MRKPYRLKRPRQVAVPENMRAEALAESVDMANRLCDTLLVCNDQLDKLLKKLDAAAVSMKALEGIYTAVSVPAAPAREPVQLASGSLYVNLPHECRADARKCLLDRLNDCERMVAAAQCSEPIRYTCDDAEFYRALAISRFDVICDGTHTTVKVSSHN